MNFFIHLIIGIWICSILVEVIIAVTRLAACLTLLVLGSILSSAAHILESFIWLWNTAFGEE